MNTKKAYELGAYINLDDYTHIDFLKDLTGIPETIFCRYNPGGVFELGTDIMDKTSRDGSKAFWCSFFLGK